MGQHFLVAGSMACMKTINFLQSALPQISNWITATVNFTLNAFNQVYPARIIRDTIIIAALQCRRNYHFAPALYTLDTGQEQAKQHTTPSLDHNVNFSRLDYIIIIDLRSHCVGQGLPVLYTLLDNPIDLVQESKKPTLSFAHYSW